MKNIEISHFYTSDFKNHSWIDIIEHTINYRNIIQEFNGKKIILIDDKDDNISTEEKENITDMVNKKFKKEKIIIDHFFFEADFIALSEKIHKIIADKIITERFRKSNKEVSFFRHNERKIALKENVDLIEKHYCVSLSLAFSVFKNIHFGDNTILIDSKYRNTENNVAYIKNHFSDKKDSYIYI